MCLAFLMAAGFIGWGLISLLSPDTAWSFQEWSNSRKGVASERSDGWESTNRISGVTSLVVGIICFIWFLSIL
jgi:hypothetical protein